MDENFDVAKRLSTSFNFLGVLAQLKNKSVPNGGSEIVEVYFRPIVSGSRVAFENLASPL